MTTSTRYLVDVTVLVAGLFLVIMSMALGSPVVGWLGFAVSVGVLLIAAWGGCNTRRVDAWITQGALAAVALWSLIAALAFTGTALVWLVFANALAVAAVALIDLTVHESVTERVVLMSHDSGTMLLNSRRAGRRPRITLGMHPAPERIPDRVGKQPADWAFDSAPTGYRTATPAEPVPVGDDVHSQGTPGPLPAHSVRPTDARDPTTPPPAAPTSTDGATVPRQRTRADPVGSPHGRRHARGPGAAAAGSVRDRAVSSTSHGGPSRVASASASPADPPARRRVPWTFIIVVALVVAAGATGAAIAASR